MKRAMTLYRMKEPLHGFSRTHGLSSHRVIYRDVGEGVPYRSPLLKQCVVMLIGVMALAAFAFKNF